MGAAEPALDVGLVAHGLGEVHPLCGIDGAARLRQGMGRQGREPGGEGLDRIGKGGVVHALPDQAEALGLFGAQLVAQHRQADRAGAADKARQ